MPIRVKCPNCQTEFQVNDKFAGKKGPCPKCKTLIEVPKPTAATAAPATSPARGAKPSPAQPAASKPAPAQPTPPAGAGAKPAPGPAAKVVIHTPDEPTGKPGTASAAATTQRQLKPISRQDVTVKTLPTILIVTGIVAALVGAYFYGIELQTNAWLRRAVAFLIAIPCVIGGYSIFRDDELDPYRGRALWIRTLICSLLYASLWIIYFEIPATVKQQIVTWFYFLPPELLFCIGAPVFLFDLDIGSGVAHFATYVVITFALGWLAGFPAPWVGIAF